MKINSRTNALPCMLSPFQKTWCRRSVVLVFFAVSQCVSAAISFGQLPPPSTSWSVSEFQPNIQQGGRANTFAVDPADNHIIFVTSESGGLFRTVDGVHWRHLDGLPCSRTNSVAFVPKLVTEDPTILIVTANDDFKAASGGGIWRSRDYGRTWTQSVVTFPSNITARLSAYEISIEPDGSVIYIATDFGSLMSRNRGASWTYQDVFGAGANRRTISILALGDGRVIAGGPSGIRRSTDGGANWAAPVTTTVGSIEDFHAFARSPVSRQHAYVVNASTELFRSEDGGNTWTAIGSAPRPGHGGCGGIGFIKAVLRRTTSQASSRSLYLYFSNRCYFYRLVVPINPSTGDLNYTGAWQGLSSDHDDMRDLAFDDATNPLLLATDGGLHKTTDGGETWKHTGNGRDGYNALQITEVKGQYIEDISRHDLYFGTQDNSLYTSGDGGTTWPTGRCCEGFYIEVQHRVATASDSKATFVACDGGCGNWISDPLFTNPVWWRNPPGVVVGNPVILDRSMHVQPFDIAGGRLRGLAITTNLGTNWRQYARFDVEFRGLAKLARSGSASLSSIVYQPYRAGWDMGYEIQHLMLIHKPPTATTATVYYPAMTDFRLGINPTTFAHYQVFAVDPGDPLHVIAPDVGDNQRVMETTSGGLDWREVPELTNLATDGGRLLFSKSLLPFLQVVSPVISAISFSPQNPNLVLAGTIEGGIYFSTDNGSHWERIPGSELVTNVTSFYWRSANDIIVSSYGRGLWRLRSRLVSGLSDFGVSCLAPCFEGPIIPKQKPDPKLAILVYEGRVVGAEIQAGILREVFVTPGSSVLFVGEIQRQKLEIKVTETNNEVGFGSLQSQFQPPKKGWIIKGLIFGKDNALAGGVFGDKPMVLTKRKSEQEISKQLLGRQTKSPVRDKPYLHIVTKWFHGVPTATPDEAIEVTGTNFPRGAVLVIAIDSKPPRDKIQVNINGMFKAEIRAPREMGLHSLEVRAGEREKTVLDGSMFLVTHIDDSKGRIAKPK